VSDRLAPTKQQQQQQNNFSSYGWANVIYIACRAEQSYQNIVTIVIFLASLS